MGGIREMRNEILAKVEKMIAVKGYDVGRAKALLHSMDWCRGVATAEQFVRRNELFKIILNESTTTYKIGGVR